MKAETADALGAALTEMGAEWSRMDGYSGRFMYGAKTVGIVVAGPVVLYGAIARATIRLGNEGWTTAQLSAFADDLAQLCVDDLALNKIVY